MLVTKRILSVEENLLVMYEVTQSVFSSGSYESQEVVGKWHLIPAVWNDNGEVIETDIEARLRVIEEHLVL